MRPSEIGPVPEHWDVRPAGQLFGRVPLKDKKVVASSYLEHGAVPVIDQGQRYLAGYTDDRDKVTTVPTGGLVVFGDHTCVVKFVDHDFVAGADGVQVLRPRPEVTARYLAVALKMRARLEPGYSRHFAALKEAPIPVPPLAEQQAIADAAAVFESAANRYTELSDKKSNFKAAVLDAVLRRDLRLPDDGDWPSCRLGEVGAVVRGVGYDPDIDLLEPHAAGSVILLRANNVRDGALVMEDVHWVHQRRVSAVQLLAPDDIVICSSNGSRALVGKAARFRGGGQPTTVGAFMALYRSSIHPGYVEQFLQSSLYRDQVDFALSGSSINNLKPSDIESFTIPVPEPETQAFLARMFSAMDDEIADLVALRTKIELVGEAVLDDMLSGVIQP